MSSRELDETEAGMLAYILMNNHTVRDLYIGGKYRDVIYIFEKRNIKLQMLKVQAANVMKKNRMKKYAKKCLPRVVHKDCFDKYL